MYNEENACRRNFIHVHVNDSVWHCQKHLSQMHPIHEIEITNNFVKKYNMISTVGVAYDVAHGYYEGFDIYGRAEVTPQISY